MQSVNVSLQSVNIVEDIVKCPFCACTFSSQYSLDRHLEGFGRHEHLLGLLQCEFCECTFFSEYDLNRHLSMFGRMEHKVDFKRFHLRVNVDDDGFIEEHYIRSDIDYFPNGTGHDGVNHVTDGEVEDYWNKVRLATLARYEGVFSS